MADKIALETEAKTIGGGSTTAVTNKCCTKSSAETFGCSVSGTYASNQLVAMAHLSKKTTSLGTAFVNINMNSSGTQSTFRGSITDFTTSSGVVMTICVTNVNKSNEECDWTFRNLSLASSPIFINQTSVIALTNPPYDTTINVELISITSGYTINFTW